MKITQKTESSFTSCSKSLRSALLLMGFAAIAVLMGSISAVAQRNIRLDPITITADQDRVIPADKGSQGTHAIVEGSFKSSSGQVAAARTFGTSGSVQLFAKAPGTTEITWNRVSTSGEVGTVTISVTVLRREHKSIFDKPDGGNGGNNDGGGNNSGGGNNGGGGAKPPVEGNGPAVSDITDHAAVGKPIRQNTKDGGYKEIFKNKAGQVVQEREYNKAGDLVSTKDIEAVYGNDAPASADIKNSKGELESQTYDANGNIVDREIYTELNEFGQATKKEVRRRGQATKVYKRDPKSDKWVEQKDPIKGGDLNVPKPDVKGNGKVDRCLVGTWVSATGTTRDGSKGLAGVTLSIKGDGTAEIDYSDSSPLEGRPDLQTGKPIQVQKYTGKAAGHIETSDAKIVVTSVESSALTGEITTNGTTQQRKPSGLGVILLSKGGPENRYTCTDLILTIETNVFGTSASTYQFTKVF